jgi:hypothetical protein
MVKCPKDILELRGLDGESLFDAVDSNVSVCADVLLVIKPIL